MESGLASPSFSTSSHDLQILGTGTHWFFIYNPIKGLIWRNLVFPAKKGNSSPVLEIKTSRSTPFPVSNSHKNSINFLTLVSQITKVFPTNPWITHLSFYFHSSSLVTSACCSFVFAAIVSVSKKSFYRNKNVRLCIITWLKSSSSSSFLSTNQQNVVRGKKKH